MSDSMKEVVETLDPVSRRLLPDIINTGTLVPLKTTLELRDNLNLGEAYITRAPTRYTNEVVNIVRALVGEDSAKNLPHLRRCSKPNDLPPHLKNSFMNEGQTGRAIHTGKSQWLYILLGPTETMSYDELVRGLCSIDGIRDDIFVGTIPVPLLAPTSQIQANMWSQQYWQTVYRKNNPLGPHPSNVCRTTSMVERDADIWMSLAHDIARKANKAGLGEPIGAVIVKRTLPSKPDTQPVKANTAKLDEERYTDRADAAPAQGDSVQGEAMEANSEMGGRKSWSDASRPKRGAMGSLSVSGDAASLRQFIREVRGVGFDKVSSIIDSYFPKTDADSGKKTSFNAVDDLADADLFTRFKDCCDEIIGMGLLCKVSNEPGAVREHILKEAERDKTTGRAGKPALFIIYESGRAGPHSGCRLCLVNKGFHIALPSKPEYEAEQKIGQVEDPIGEAIEWAILGEPPKPQPEKESVEIVAMAGDARWYRQERTGRTGNPMAHAAMRAISIVAQKLVRAEDREPTASKPILEFEAFQDKPLLQDEQLVFVSDHPSPDGYLCHELELYMTHEPCTMCAMAILHSRMGKIVFRHRMSMTGGMGSEDRDTCCGMTDACLQDPCGGGKGLGLHWRKELNWSMLGWEWETDMEENLSVDPHLHA